MRKLLLVSALSILACGIVSADDQVRSAQESLKSQGFYTGPIDGEMNPDTGKAIRRFQIRNGIDATGQLDEATVNALKQAGTAAQPTPETAEPQPVTPPAPEAPEKPVPPPVVQPPPPDQNDLRNRPEQPPTEAPGTVPSGPRADAAFAQIYQRSPFWNAPRVVQVDTLRKAQAILAKAGIYDRAPDGEPSPALEEALIRYQSHYHLQRTGRLDIDTLAQMHLLPVSHIPVKPFRGGPHSGERPPHAVRGEEVPDDQPPALRGIPAD